MLGYPIRKPPDQRSVANSPGHIAGSHVLHRLLMPRHPPCALKNLNTTIYKMLAFTMQFSKHERTPPQPPPTPTTPHKTPAKQPMRYGGQEGPHAQTPPTNQADRARSGLKTRTPTTGVAVSSGPNSVPGPTDPPRDGFPEPAKGRAVLTSMTGRRDRIASAPPMSRYVREAFAHGTRPGPPPPRPAGSVWASDAP